MAKQSPDVKTNSQRDWRWGSVGLLAILLIGTGRTAEPADFYVAKVGNDAWSGTRPEPAADKTDGPFASLERARDAIRALKKSGQLAHGATVHIRGGVYELSHPFALVAEDSGAPNAPIVYAASAGETVRLLAGKCLTGFETVRDPNVLDRMAPEARRRVIQVDLKKEGIADLGNIATDDNRLEFFYRNQPMTLARWPNEGFVKIVDVLEPEAKSVRGIKRSKVGKFFYEGDRPLRWLKEKDLWLHGYWFWDWSPKRQQVESIDPQKRLITLKPPASGDGYRQGQWYYAFNALSELDQPGEWYLDRDAHTLYFWPPGPLDEGTVVASLLPTLVSMQNVSNVDLHGLCLEASRGAAVRITRCSHCRVAACTIRNCGDRAVIVSDGDHNVVQGCDISGTGGGGISLTGGDRGTLTPAGHLADNNHIHHYARWERVYRPGIDLQGVGNRATHNLIDNAPHMAIGFGGNDHRIEFNEIHSVCYESSDAGAIYCGRDWTMRGTVIRHNYMHDIDGFEHRGCVGVYLDDMFCGTEIDGNVFYRVTRAAFIGGGRDCVVKNNLFVDCRPSLHIDARALGWAHGSTDGWVAEIRRTGKLGGIAFKRPPYSQRYPALVSVADDEPAAPKGNKVFHNISFGGKWDEIERAARSYQIVSDNLVDTNPGFVSPERIGVGKEPRPVDFSLSASSPAWSVGFQKIPLAQIGLYQDANRASWPVRDTARP